MRRSLKKYFFVCEKKIFLLKFWLLEHYLRIILYFAAPWFKRTLTDKDDHVNTADVRRIEFCDFDGKSQIFAI